MVFDADIGVNLFAGQLVAAIEVPLGEADNPVSVFVDLGFDSQGLSGTIVTSISERYIGDRLLWLEDAEITTQLMVKFEPSLLELDFTATADKAILFVEEVLETGNIPSGTATLTGIYRDIESRRRVGHFDYGSGRGDFCFQI